MMSEPKIHVRKSELQCTCGRTFAVEKQLKNHIHKKRVRQRSRREKFLKNKISNLLLPSVRTTKVNSFIKSVAAQSLAESVATRIISEKFPPHNASLELQNSGTEEDSFFSLDINSFSDEREDCESGDDFLPKGKDRIISPNSTSPVKLERKNLEEKSASLVTSGVMTSSTPNFTLQHASNVVPLSPSSSRSSEVPPILSDNCEKTLTGPLCVSSDAHMTYEDNFETGIFSANDTVDSGGGGGGGDTSSQTTSVLNTISNPTSTTMKSGVPVTSRVASPSILQQPRNSSPSRTSKGASLNDDLIFVSTRSLRPEAEREATGTDAIAMNIAKIRQLNENCSCQLRSLDSDAANNFSGDVTQEKVKFKLLDIQRLLRGYVAHTEKLQQSEGISNELSRECSQLLTTIRYNLLWLEQTLSYINAIPPSAHQVVRTNEGGDDDDDDEMAEYDEDDQKADQEICDDLSDCDIDDEDDNSEILEKSFQEAEEKLKQPRLVGIEKEKQQVGKLAGVALYLLGALHVHSFQTFNYPLLDATDFPADDSLKDYLRDKLSSEESLSLTISLPPQIQLAAFSFLHQNDFSRTEKFICCLQESKPNDYRNLFSSPTHVAAKFLADTRDCLIEAFNIRKNHRTICPGITTIELLQFVDSKYGATVKEGFGGPRAQPLAVMSYDKEGRPDCLRAVDCHKFLDSRHQRCAVCRKVAKKCADAKRNYNESVKLKKSMRIHSLSKQDREVLKQQKKRDLDDLRELITERIENKIHARADKSGFGLILEDSEESITMRKAFLLIKQGKLSKEHFVFKEIASFVENASKKDSRAFRWDPAVIHFMETIRYYGGSRTVNKMIGKGSKDHTVDLTNYAQIQPSNSTLKRHAPSPVLFPTLEEQQAKTLADALHKANSSPYGIISFDEIKPMHGAVYLVHLRAIVGFDRLIKEREVLERNPKGELILSDKWLKDHEATGIIQFFWTELYGRASVPLVWIATNVIDVKEIEKAILEFKAVLEKAGLKPLGVSSDGFSGSISLSSSLKKNKLSYFYDYNHMHKNFRNSLLNSGFYVAEDDVTISMKELALRWLSETKIQELPTELRKKAEKVSVSDHLLPADRMAWEPVKTLMDVVDIVEFWGKTDKMAAATGKFLSKLRELYQCFQFIHESRRIPTPLHHRIDKMKAILSWFEENYKRATELRKPTITDQSLTHLQITVESFVELEAFMKNQKLEQLLNISWLSTLVVENFFALIRAKCPYPTVWDYAVNHTKAMKELIKRVAIDNPVPQANVAMSSAYANIEGLRFSVKDIELFFPVSAVKKKAFLKQQRAQNAGSTPEYVARCKHITSMFAPSRRTLSLRQSVCKNRSGIGAAGGLYPCPHAGCPEWRIYYSSYVRHKQTCLYAPVEENGESPETVRVVDGNDNQVEVEKALLDLAEELEKSIQPLPSPASNGTDIVVLLIDVETTGTKLQAVIEIAIFDPISGRVFRRLIKPIDEFGNQALISPYVPHKISSHQLRDKPTWTEIVPELEQWVREVSAGKFVIMVGHNASFDRARIIAEYERCKLPVPEWGWFDTLRLARQKLQISAHQKGAALQDLCRKYNINSGEAHSAEDDAKATWSVAKALLLDDPEASERATFEAVFLAYQGVSQDINANAVKGKSGRKCSVCQQTGHNKRWHESEHSDNSPNKRVKPSTSQYQSQSQLQQAKNQEQSHSKQTVFSQPILKQKSILDFLESEKSLSTAITSEQQEEIQKIVEGSNFERSIQRIPGDQTCSVMITKEHLLRLYNNDWLNDDILTAYAWMVEQRERDKKICFVDPLFYARLVENGILILNNVQRWRHKRDLLDCDSVYFIINDNNQHWFLIVADFTSKRWRVFDSIREAPSRAVFVGHIRQYLEFLFICKHEGSGDNKKRRCTLFNDWEILHQNRNHLQQQYQTNNYDCGIFCCGWIEHLTRTGSCNFTQQDTPAMRARIILNFANKLPLN